MWKSSTIVCPARTVTLLESGAQPGSVAVNVYVPACRPPTWYAPDGSVSVDPFSGPNQETVAYATFVLPTTAPCVVDGARSINVRDPRPPGLR